MNYGLRVPVPLNACLILRTYQKVIGHLIPCGVLIAALGNYVDLIQG
jgi:hypothetical protein